MLKALWKWPKRSLKRGQALAEYSIIVAIIAIASIAVLTIFGKQVRSLIFGSAQQIAGQEDAAPDDLTTGQEGTVNTDINDW